MDVLREQMEKVVMKTFHLHRLDFPPTLLITEWFLTMKTIADYSDPDLPHLLTAERGPRRQTCRTPIPLHGSFPVLHLMLSCENLGIKGETVTLMLPVYHQNAPLIMVDISGTCQQFQRDVVGEWSSNEPITWHLHDFYVSLSHSPLVSSVTQLPVLKLSNWIYFGGSSRFRRLGFYTVT